MDEQEQLDRFAGQLYQGILAPEALRDVIDSLSAWLTEPPAIHDFDMGMPIVGADGCLADNDDPDRAAYLDAPLRIAPPVRRRRRCPECPIQQDINPNWQRVIDLLLHCRALRELADHAVELGPHQPRGGHCPEPARTRSGLRSAWRVPASDR